MDRLTSMTVFTKVVENMGFSAAGRRLNMSATMVSNHVQALEERLGVRLLNRTTRKLSLTEAGRTYYDRCSQILAEIAEADEAVGELQTTPRGVLRLNISPALAPEMGPIIGEYVRAYRDAAVDMIATDRMVDLVDEGFDLAVRVTPVDEPNLIVRRLGTYRHVLCAAPAYIARHGSPGAPADLVNHNCINYSYHPFGRDWRFKVGGSEQAVHVSGNFVSNSGVTLVAVALMGQGLVLLPSFMIAQHLKAGRLVPVLADFLVGEFEINALYAHRRHLSAKVRVFIDLLIQHLNLDS
ncbi:MAG TPA: LysR family transcriptional regulator [Alphaproteobacteria bacterium]|nr:LysR family transcriptional regulator [Alphaproteobacteria bacterium]